MKSGKEYIYFSRVEPDVKAGGGCRRCAQIHQLLAPIDFEFVTSRRAVPNINNDVLQRVYCRLKSRFNVLDRLERYIITDGEYHLWHPEHRKSVYNRRSISRQWAHLSDKIANKKLAFMDDPIYFVPLVKILKKHGIPIVALSQNIESLVPGQVTLDGQRVLLNKEIDILSGCDLVVTISREEAFLLTNLGINTIFLPYYPVDTIEKRMLKVRENRIKTDKKDIILIGSALNKPTKQGMADIIKAWKDYGLSRFGERLLVAGYGTEGLRNISEGDGIEFLGPVEDEELDKRLSVVKACLCYQEKGAGALTRIQEMLIAGVPVLANHLAARTYYNSKGVIEFSCFEEMEQALRDVEAIEGNIPIPDPPATAHLLSTIRKLIDDDKRKSTAL